MVLKLRIFIVTSDLDRYILFFENYNRSFLKLYNRKQKSNIRTLQEKEVESFYFAFLLCRVIDPLLLIGPLLIRGEKHMKLVGGEIKEWVEGGLVYRW